MVAGSRSMVARGISSGAQQHLLEQLRRTDVNRLDLGPADRSVEYQYLRNALETSVTAWKTHHYIAAELKLLRAARVLRLRDFSYESIEGAFDELTGAAARFLTEERKAARLLVTRASDDNLEKAEGTRLGRFLGYDAQEAFSAMHTLLQGSIETITRDDLVQILKLNEALKEQLARIPWWFNGQLHGVSALENASEDFNRDRGVLETAVSTLVNATAELDNALRNTDGNGAREAAERLSTALNMLDEFAPIDDAPEPDPDLWTDYIRLRVAALRDIVMYLPVVHATRPATHASLALISGAIPDPTGTARPKWMDEIAELVGSTSSSDSAVLTVDDVFTLALQHLAIECGSSDELEKQSSVFAGTTLERIFANDSLFADSVSRRPTDSTRAVVPTIGNDERIAIWLHVTDWYRNGGYPTRFPGRREFSPWEQLLSIRNPDAFAGWILRGDVDILVNSLDPASDRADEALIESIKNGYTQSTFWNGQPSLSDELLGPHAEGPLDAIATALGHEGRQLLHELHIAARPYVTDLRRRRNAQTEIDDVRQSDMEPRPVTPDSSTGIRRRFDSERTAPAAATKHKPLRVTVRNNDVTFLETQNPELLANEHLPLTVRLGISYGSADLSTVHDGSAIYVPQACALNVECKGMRNVLGVDSPSGRVRISAEEESKTVVNWADCETLSMRADNEAKLVFASMTVREYADAYAYSGGRITIGSNSQVPYLHLAACGGKISVSGYVERAEVDARGGKIDFSGVLMGLTGTAFENSKVTIGGSIGPSVSSSPIITDSSSWVVTTHNARSITWPAPGAERFAPSLR